MSGDTTQLHTYIVRSKLDASSTLPEVHRAVKAAYYRTDKTGRFLEFVDENHKAVYFIDLGSVHDVSRRCGCSSCADA